MKTKFFSLLALLLALTGCVTKNRYSSPAYETRGGSKSHYNVRYLDDNDKKMEEDHRQMIYNASVTIESKNPDSAAVHVTALAKKYNGYVLTSGNNYTTIRIKAASLKDAITDLSGIGKIKNKNISGTDVTEEYTDNQIRLENAMKARARYLELLQKASNVGETLAVEKELERLNGVIDQLKGKLNRLEHLVEYSTLTVYHEEKVKPGIIGYVFVGLYKGVKWLFVRN